MLGLTHLPVVSLPALLVVATAFSVFVSRRMVPGLALLAAAPYPAMRGSVVSVNEALQSLAMVGGLMMSRSPDGLVQGYGRAGWMALLSTLIIVWLVGVCAVASVYGFSSRASPVSR
jgi:hypothetical protein